MSTSHEGCLGLELENQDATMLIEFPVDDDNAFSVGSSPHAGLRIERPGVAPIEFYVQREANALWLVPAYASADLRLDAQRVTGRRELVGRSLLELTHDVLVIRVHEPHELEAVRAQQEDDRTKTRIYTKSPSYVEKLPAEADATQVAMQPPRRSNHPIAFSETEAVPVVSIPKEDSVPAWQKTVEIPRFQAQTWLGERVALPDRDRTVLDMPVAEPAPAPRPQRAAPAARTRKHGANSLLGKLGVLAKRCPVPVAVGALATALVASLALVALARDPKPTRSKSPPPAAAANGAIVAKAQPVASSGSSAPSAPSIPSVRVLGPKAPSAPAASAEPKRAGSGPVDPELVEATEHLVAGRDSQAKAAYARLARRSPDELAYAVAAHLLERMAACTDPNTRLQVSCPKVKR